MFRTLMLVCSKLLASQEQLPVLVWVAGKGQLAAVKRGHNWSVVVRWQMVVGAWLLHVVTQWLVVVICGCWYIPPSLVLGRQRQENGGK